MLSDRCLSVCLSVPSCLSVTFVHWDQTVGRIKMKLGGQVGLGLGHIVLDGGMKPVLGTEPPPQFSASFYCGQTAGWIKMPLDTEVGFGLGNFVLDGDPALSQKGGHSPTQLSAHVCCSQTAECIKIHSVRR